MRRHFGLRAMMTAVAVLIAGCAVAIPGFAAEYDDEGAIDLGYLHDNTGTLTLKGGAGASVSCEGADGRNLEVNCSHTVIGDTVRVTLAFKALNYDKEHTQQTIIVTAKTPLVVDPDEEGGPAGPTVSQGLYSVTMLPPADPVAPSFAFGYEVQQGNATVVDYATFYAQGVTCQGCEGKEETPTFTSLDVSPPEAGNASFNASGLSVQTSSTYTGSMTVEYQVSDPYGQSSVGHVSLTVVETPRATPAPVTVVDSARTSMGKPVTLNVLANDSDPSGGKLTLLSVTDPVNGRVTFSNDGRVTYYPNPGFRGVDQFSYQVANEAGITATGMVAIGVDADPGPVVRDLTAQQKAQGEDSAKAGVSEAQTDAKLKSLRVGLLKPLRLALIAINNDLAKAEAISGGGNGTGGNLPTTGAQYDPGRLLAVALMTIMLGFILTAALRPKRTGLRPEPPAAP